MVNETSGRPRLTPKGERTRARIVEEAAVLIHERGVAGTTLDDVKAAAEVSGSPRYHQFPAKTDPMPAVTPSPRPAPPTTPGPPGHAAGRRGPPRPRDAG